MAILLSLHQVGFVMQKKLIGGTVDHDCTNFLFKIETFLQSEIKFLQQNSIGLFT
jgi:hypothetical protein